VGGRVGFGADGRLVGVIVMNVVAFVWIAAVPGLWPHKGKRLTRRA
jgi:hypothetical protein